MIIVDESYDVLTVTENGYGKRTPVSEYRKTNRGGSGIINIKVTEKNGNVVALKGVKDGSDLMLITRNGIIIRVDVDKVSTIGRNTQGVKLISLDEDDSVIDVALCDRETDDDSEGGQTESIPEAIPEGIMEEEAEDSFKVPEEESGSEDEGQDSEGQAGTDTSKE